jgi:hypothetical protein
MAIKDYAGLFTEALIKAGEEFNDKKTMRDIRHVSMIRNNYVFGLAGGLLAMILMTDRTLVECFMYGFSYSTVIGLLLASLTKDGKDALLNGEKLNDIAFYTIVTLTALACLWFMTWPLRLIPGELGGWAAFCMIMPMSTVAYLKCLAASKRLEEEATPIE